ncbi:hypothetical protein NC652_004813 [Populus alba x Populus x berolinensis]|nr:hypothetical protein NC652_004813 [Populus alba x Populus x berolinensis]
MAHGLGRAFIGFIVQPVSGTLDFFSLTVDGIGALNNKTTPHRFRNPRAIRADGILREYSEKEASGQMIHYLAEAKSTFWLILKYSRRPSKFAMCFDPRQDKIKKPSKIYVGCGMGRSLWPLELAKAGCQPTFSLASSILRVLRESRKFCPGAMLEKMTKHQKTRKPKLLRSVSDLYRNFPFKPEEVHVLFCLSEADGREPHNPNKAIIKSRELSSHQIMHLMKEEILFGAVNKYLKAGANYIASRLQKTLEYVNLHWGHSSCWRHPPNVTTDRLFALPLGYEPGVEELVRMTTKLPSICFGIHGLQKDIFILPHGLSYLSGQERCPSTLVALRQTMEESDWKPMRVS